MPTVAPRRGDRAARDTIMPAARPLFATPVEPAAAPALTRRGVVAGGDLPVGGDGGAAGGGAAVGAVEPDGARRVAPPRTLLAAIAAGEAPAVAVDRAGVASERPLAARAARGGAPAEYVAPTVAAAETLGRLPGGRTPRGSFTLDRGCRSSRRRCPRSGRRRRRWPWPSTRRQAAPGTPLWGAMPPLIAVVAVGGGERGAGVATTAAPAAGAIATATSGGCARTVAGGGAAGARGRDGAHATPSVARRRSAASGSEASDGDRASRCAGDDA